MADLILEPYAVIQHWHAPAAKEHWENLLVEYVQTLARRCSSIGPCVIGHIKGLAFFPDESYFRVSVVSQDRSASTEGKIPPGFTDLEFTLNVLIYGLKRKVLEEFTRETSQEIAAIWKGTVTCKDTNQASHHLHNSNHHGSRGG